jgi:hypothetical protein
MRKKNFIKFLATGALSTFISGSSFGTSANSNIPDLKNILSNNNFQVIDITEQEDMEEFILSIRNILNNHELQLLEDGNVKKVIVCVDNRSGEITVDIIPKDGINDE